MITRLRYWLSCLGKALVAGATARAQIDDSADVRPVEGVKTLYDEVKDRWPTASPDAIDSLLWLTPYPAASRDTVVASLSVMRERWGPNIADAINGEYAEFDRMWKEYRERKPNGT